MPKKLFLLMCVGAFSLLCGNVNEISAQSRKSVSAAEVNGTFRDYFSGNARGSYNEIKILALGRGQLKVSFNLTYPYKDAAGAMTANVGEATGEAEISGDTATFTTTELGDCKITIKFVKPGTIRVGQHGASECGFGFNVSATGTYKKTSGPRPKF